eukprot:1492739-Alexandrium_andersonii.AAC.1
MAGEPAVQPPSVPGEPGQKHVVVAELDVVLLLDRGLQGPARGEEGLAEALHHAVARRGVAR